MSWKPTRITTPGGEPALSISDGLGGRTRLVLTAAGFEACLRMDADVMRDLRDELTERLAAVENKEAA